MRNCLAYLVLVPLAACGGVIRHQAAGTTAEILAAAQPALERENDYELASKAIPGALKTIEGFYVADEQPVLRAILTEGYCQYATAFVEDEWEIADFAGKIDEKTEQNLRARKMFARCLNYALQDLPGDFAKTIYGDPKVGAAKIAAIDAGLRTPLMWAGLGLGGVVQHNLSNTDAMSEIDTVKAILARVVAIDTAQRGQIDGTKGAPCDAPCVVHLALPHVAFGLLYSTGGSQFGGDAKRATEEFQTALRISADPQHPDGRLLLARVMWGYKVGRMTNDRKLFHDQLVKVLETDPAIWPEERLANEVAQRRARRYLSHEKEWFQ